MKRLIIVLHQAIINACHMRVKCGRKTRLNVQHIVLVILAKKKLQNYIKNVWILAIITDS